MADVAVVFHSDNGSTQQLAQAVHQGCISVGGVSSELLQITGKAIIEGRFRNPELLQQLEPAKAIIFGSPTYMGCVSAQFKAFADATGDLWEQQRWANKIAAGFTIGSNLSGDQLNTLQYLQVFASQHGMLWAGLDVPGTNSPGEGTTAMKPQNRLGAQSGLVAHSADGVVHSGDLASAVYLGQRVARISQQLAF
ncbi:flavodoxin family protein [Halioxenophilus aromaticivorans]|uniref:Flavodoxin family protein n=1 Tax=Halioxenophilus aromaticivorans TaxID=1306992 RepID=A0AAV3UA41_9ALTE